MKVTYGSELETGFGHDGNFITYTTQDGLPDNVIRSLFSDNKGGFIVSTPRGLARWQGGRFHSWPLPTQVQPNNPSESAYYCDSSGALWYTNRTSLHRYKDAQLTSYPLVANPRGYQVNTIYEDRQGSIWIGTVDAGLARLKDGQFTFFTTKDGLPDPFVTTIYEDLGGNLWVGTRAGLAYMKENSFAI
jgi:ligand-binding sensor domain-containing protein